MLLNQFKLKQLSVLFLIASLAACVAPDRYEADQNNPELSWLKLDHKRIAKQGTFPDLENIHKVRIGMTKKQLYALLGTPFISNYFRGNEWEYIFHFHKEEHGSEKTITCQYKIVFDNDRKYVQNFYWRAVKPSNATCPPDTVVSEYKQIPPQ